MNKYQPCSPILVLNPHFRKQFIQIITSRTRPLSTLSSRLQHSTCLCASPSHQTSSPYKTSHLQIADVRQLQHQRRATSQYQGRRFISTTMSSKLVPANPAEVMVIRDVTPHIATLSLPFARHGIFKVGGRATISKYTRPDLRFYTTGQPLTSSDE